MEILVLGGTAFLGRHLVDAAQARGHNVTLFNRGETNPELFPDVEKLHGDRDGNLETLRHRHWDAVIDPSGYVPRVVRKTLDLLQNATNHYTFISSVSVYADFSRAGLDEFGEVGNLADEANEDVEENYGPLKALCEREIESVFGSRGLIIRPGLIVGPHDPTNRFTYWVKRFAQGGEVLLPGSPDKPIQFIDVRDLARWIITSVESKTSGVFNATGPDYRLTMGRFVEELRGAVQSKVNPNWVDEAFLLAHEVQEFVELPLWISDKTNWPGFLTVNVEKAISHGLSFRPLEETIVDTQNWAQSLSEKQPSVRPQGAIQAGMSTQREEKLLQAWKSRQSGEPQRNVSRPDA